MLVRRNDDLPELIPIVLQGFGVEPLYGTQADAIHFYDQFAKGNIILRINLLAITNLWGDNRPFFHLDQPFPSQARCLEKGLLTCYLIRQELVYGPEVLSSEIEERLPLRGFLLLFQNILNHGEREE